MRIILRTTFQHSVWKIIGIWCSVIIDDTHVKNQQAHFYNEGGVGEGPSYRSSTRGPEDDSVESKHVAPLSHYMFNFTTVVFGGLSPPPLSLLFYKHFGMEHLRHFYMYNQLHIIICHQIFLVTPVTFFIVSL